MATEKRLIDANALKSNMCEYCNKYFSEEPCEPSECVFIQFVNEQPTMDAVEVVHGRTEAIEPFEVTLTRRCCLCGVAMGNLDFYCPNCGAKMDGDGK